MVTMRHLSGSAVTPYCVAILAALCAVVVRWLIDPLFDHGFRLIFLYGAVAFSVWYSGYLPALLAAVLGYGMSNYLFMGEPGTFDRSQDTLVGFVAYLLSCSLLIGFGEATHRANRRILARDETLQTTLSSIVDAVIATDEQGRITQMNKAAASLTGWAPDAALGQSITDVFRIFDVATGKPLNCLSADALKRSQAHSINNARLQDRNNATHLISGRVVPLTGVTPDAGYLLIFHDITDERRREELLLQNERELSDFFNNAIFGIHWVGPSGEILRANQAELDLLGYTREEYLGRNITEFHVNPKNIEQMLERVKNGEVLREYPAQLRRKDGGIEHVLISCNALFENGKFVHSRCFTRVITDRKHAEEARMRLADIVAASDDAIVTKSLDGTILSWNKGAEEILGYSEAEILGQSDSVIVPPELQEEETAILNRVRAGERIHHFETIRRRKDGRLINLSMTISPILDEAGNIVGASKVGRDITERKEIEETRARLAAIVEASDDAIVSKSLDGIIRSWNAGAERILGYSEEEMIGKSINIIIPPDLQDEEASIIRRIRQGERVLPFETVRQTKSGHLIDLSITVSPVLDDAGRVIGASKVARDITERKQAEKALKEADQRKDEFLATLAHELRNPLAPISNSLEILKHADHTPELLRQSRETIERQLTHMVRLVDDLLNISRISQDKLILRPTQVELSTIVQQAVETAAPVIEQFHHSLAIELPDEPVYLHADPVRLAQVLSNLLNNACKYTQPGGNIALTAQLQHNRVRIGVKDNGIGIQPEQLEAIFDMFGQAKTGHAESLGGLGIGLTLAKRLVEMHDGEISAFSEGPGCGSEIVVHLPVITPISLPHPEPDTIHEASVTPRRVLVVDDNVDGADTLAVLLQISGHEVQLAHDGLAAVKVAEEFRPHVILLDIGLPKLDGYGVCRRIRAQAWGKTITIAALTGWGQEQDQRKSTEAGFDAHLIKPVNYADISHLMENSQHAELGV